MLQVVEGGLLSYERGPFAFDDLTAYQVRPVKAHLLDALALRSGPGYHAHSPLRVTARHFLRLQSHHVVSKLALTIRLVYNIVLHQYQYVDGFTTCHPDGLHGTGSPAFADVVVPEV